MIDIIPSWEQIIQEYRPTERDLPPLLLIQIQRRSLGGNQKLAGFPLPLLFRLLSLSNGFDPPRGAVVDHLLSGGAARRSKWHHQGPSICTSSFSSGGSSLNFCGGLVSHNSGFLGPFYSPEGLQDSFCKGTSIIVVSNSVPCSSTTFKSLEGGGADSTGKEGCRDCERYHLSTAGFS